MPDLNRPLLAVVILTYNEAIHIRRCIESVKSVADEIVVVDSGSTDGTQEIAKSLGAKVYKHPWVNYAIQFNWALDHVPIEAKWIMRLDADEYPDKTLVEEIRSKLLGADEKTCGYAVRRPTTFLGKRIRFGGISPRLLRIWRTGQGRCEMRWMDEHIVLERGDIQKLKGNLVDHNLNYLTWWMDKHNRYASREAVDLLLESENVSNAARMSTGAKVKRWLKRHAYAFLPLGFRAFMFWIYRMTFRLGVLDGPRGWMFHTLQGLCYRILVDAKIVQVRWYQKEKKCSLQKAIGEVLDIDLCEESQA